MSESLEMLYERIDDLEDALCGESERADESERLVTELFHAFHSWDAKHANQMWHDEPTLHELLPEKSFPRVPGKCVGETMLVDTKSYCGIWCRWTNCREVDHCTIGGTDGE